MYRHSHTIFLQKQGAWPFWKIWIFLNKDRLWSAIEHLSGDQPVFCQFIVSMLRYTNIAGMYQRAYFLKERAQVLSSISAGVSLTIELSQPMTQSDARSGATLGRLE
jgi:hypothetical protein